MLTGAGIREGNQGHARVQQSPESSGQAKPKPRTPRGGGKSGATFWFNEKVLALKNLKTTDKIREVHRLQKKFWCPPMLGARRT